MADGQSLRRRLIAYFSCFSVVVAGWLLSQAPARAQQPSAEPPGYRAQIEAGLAEYDAGNFPEARALFAKAHALYPNARTLRVLGMTEFELRHYPQSLDYLKQALASTVHPLDADLRQQTEQLVERTRQFVGQVRLSLQPANAQVLVDGAIVQVSPDGLQLQVGEHVLEAQADKYRPEKRNLDIAGGETLSLQIALSPELITAASPPPAAATSTSTPLYQSLWLWAGIGVVLAGAAVGLVFALKPDQVGKAVSTDHTPTGVSLQALRGR